MIVKQMIQKGFIETIKVTKCYNPIIVIEKADTGEYLFFQPIIFAISFQTDFGDAVIHCITNYYLR